MKKNVFLQGIRDGIPIGLGYFAVAFYFGIVAYPKNIISSIIKTATIFLYLGSINFIKYPDKIDTPKDVIPHILQGN